MTTAEPAACVVCGRVRWTRLPDPGPQSMASDWRLVPEPLGRSMCDACGLVRRPHTAAAGSALYASGYGLYAHTPGEAREQARQQEYARWIAGAVPGAPARVLDVGCGNGSLLRALRAHWPQATLLGCDPSAESVTHGSGEGLQLWRGTAEDLPGDIAVDLLISVNVIEHTPDPVTFLRAGRRALVPDGHMVLVCPDGSIPNLDLLFADHLFSFARTHVQALFPRAGLDVVTASLAPAALGSFQMAVGRPATVSNSETRFDAPHAAAFHGYLDRWRRLDDHIQTRVHAPAVCFGAGEAAGLLRAYAPRTWASIRACTVDGAARGTFGALPIIPLDAVRADDTILVGVRPSDQPHVARRLEGRFDRVVTWYDFLDGGQRV